MLPRSALAHSLGAPCECSVGAIPAHIRCSGTPTLPAPEVQEPRYLLGRPVPSLPTIKLMAASSVPDKAQGPRVQQVLGVREDGVEAEAVLQGHPQHLLQEARRAHHLPPLSRPPSPQRL